jgi:hypothetical protein
MVDEDRIFISTTESLLRRYVDFLIFFVDWKAEVGNSRSGGPAEGPPLVYT